MPDFSDLLIYDPTASSCLRWLNNGNVAGTLDVYGYWVIRYQGKGYKAHRVILILHGHDIIDKVVDHIDGNRSNNLITNLRITDWDNNTRNAKKNKRNTSGVTGVSKQGNFWRANWYFNKVQNVKMFDIRTYGDEEAFQLAVQYRKEQIQKLKNIGLNYTERHGT